MRNSDTSIFETYSYLYPWLVSRNSTGNDGSAIITATGGTTPYTFGLAGVNQTSTSTNTTGVFTGLSAGTYAYFITDANGCAQECIGQFSLIRDCVANNPGGSRRPASAERTDYLLVNVNKTATSAKVNWSASTDSRLSLTILDANGKQISEQILGTNMGTMDLNVTSLLTNNYFVVLKDQNGNIISTNRMKITR